MKTFHLQCWMNIYELSHPGSYIRLIWGASSIVLVQFAFLLITQHVRCIWVPFTWPVLVLNHHRERTRLWVATIFLAGLALLAWVWSSVAMLTTRFTFLAIFQIFHAEVWALIRCRWPLDVGMDLCVGSADTVALAL